MKDLPGFNVFVVSLPRCGSSMMTGIVERLGVNVIHTSENDDAVERRKEQYQRMFGEYVPNEKFYEIIDDQWGCWRKVCDTPYSGCKVIIPLGGMRLDAMFSQPAKVIMMWRDPEEIRQSQEAFYKRPRVGGTPEEDESASEFARAQLRTMLAGTEVMLEARQQKSNSSRFGGVDVPPFEVMKVQYRQVLEDPEKVINQVANFIQAPQEIWNAVRWVDPAKIRFKAEELEQDI